MSLFGSSIYKIPEVEENVFVQGTDTLSLGNAVLSFNIQNVSLDKDLIVSDNITADIVNTDIINTDRIDIGGASFTYSGDNNDLILNRELVIQGSFHIKDEVQKVENDVDDLKNDVSDNKNDIDDLQNDVSDNKNDVDELRNGWTETSGGGFDDLGIPIDISSTDYLGVKDLNSAVNDASGAAAAGISAAAVANGLAVTAQSTATAAQATASSALTLATTNQGAIQTINSTKIANQTSVLGVSTTFTNTVRVSNGVSSTITFEGLTGKINGDDLQLNNNAEMRNATLNGTLYVTESSQFHNNVDIIGVNSHLNMQSGNILCNNATLNGDLYVSNNSQFHSDVFILSTSNLLVSGNIETTGITINDTLYTSGIAQFHGGLNMHSNLSIISPYTLDSSSASILNLKVNTIEKTDGISNIIMNNSLQVPEVIASGKPLKGFDR